MSIMFCGKVFTSDYNHTCCTVFLFSTHGDFIHRQHIRKMTSQSTKRTTIAVSRQGLESDHRSSESQSEISPDGDSAQNENYTGNSNNSSFQQQHQSLSEIKEKSDNPNHSPSKNSQLIIGEPIDYSFCGIQDIKDIIKLKPNSGRRKPIQSGNKPKDKTPEETVTKSVIVSHDNELRTNGNTVEQPQNFFENKQFLTVAVRLCYNEITSITSLSSVLNEFILLAPHRLCWIDLSHNQISELSPSLFEIKTISILYLHCNNIKTKKEALKLKQFASLTKLTLFGNGIEQIDGYRAWMIKKFQNLKSLDFIRITQTDKQAALFNMENVRRSSK